MELRRSFYGKIPVLRDGGWGFEGPGLIRAGLIRARLLRAAGCSGGFSDVRLKLLWQFSSLLDPGKLLTGRMCFYWNLDTASHESSGTGALATSRLDLVDETELCAAQQGHWHGDVEVEDQVDVCRRVCRRSSESGVHQCHLVPGTLPINVLKCWRQV